VGIPVIATEAGGIPEIIGNKYNGLLVSPQNPTLLAKAILNLINDNKLRKNLATNALETVKKFDINIVVNKYIELYNELLENNG
jgi:glycosyltransferase involved in cell wall biosynthesis